MIPRDSKNLSLLLTFQSKHHENEASSQLTALSKVFPAFVPLNFLEEDTKGLFPRAVCGRKRRVLDKELSRSNKI